MQIWKKAILLLTASLCGYLSWQSFLASEGCSVCLPLAKVTQPNTPVVLVLSSQPGRSNASTWQSLCRENQIFALCSNRNVRREGWGHLVLCDLKEFQEKYANAMQDVCLFGNSVGGRAAYFLAMHEPQLSSKLIVSNGLVPSEFRTYLEKKPMAFNSLKSKNLVMLANTACSDVYQQMKNDKLFLEEKLNWKITLLEYEDRLAKCNNRREAPRSLYQKAIQLVYQQ